MINFKMIAHRGASLVCQENSVESLEYAASIGAFAVECDIRETADGQFMIYHDSNIRSKTGIDRKVGELTLQEMADILAEHGYGLLTFADLADKYSGRAPILLHIKPENPDGAFMKMLKSSGLPLICGCCTPAAVAAARQEYEPENILAFMPGFQCIADFVEAGAGIIRLWEPWLGEITPKEVRKTFGSEVWIMARDGNGSMNGSVDSLEKCLSAGADGMLLNDVVLGMNWLKEKTKI